MKVDGRNDGPTKQKRFDIFKNDSETKILLLSIKAGGTGLNIVSANIVVFVEFPYNSSEIEQAEGRVWRFGQNKVVHSIFLPCERTIDPILVARIKWKKHTTSKCIDK